MTTKYPEAYIVEPSKRKLYDSRPLKQIKAGEEEFLTNCGGLSSDQSDGRDSFIQTNPKIRFIIVGMGLMGSGKSNGFNEARKYCQLLNSTANRKEWETIEAGNVSHDDNITNNKNYKKRVRNLFLDDQYRNYEPWTQDGWNKFPPVARKEFRKKMDEIYYDVRYGTRVSNNSLVENARKTLIRKQNLDLETDGENQTERKRRLQREFQQEQDNLPVNHPGKFSQEQINKIKKIQTQGGSAKTYKNLRSAILQGKNIEYETVSSTHTTLKNLFEIIIESTKNCQHKYTYIVLGVLNLCSIQESFNQQLCRFFQDSRWFVDSLKMGNSWNGTRNNFSITWGANTIEAQNLINKIPAPKLGISNTSQKRTNDLYTSMLRLITTCNKGNVDRPNVHKGICVGFGIDILLVTYIPPSSESVNNLIATLPLSARSQHLIKSTTSGNSISNFKWDFKLVIHILTRLQYGIYGRNPSFNININCNVDTGFRDIHNIIDIFLNEKRSSKSKRVVEFTNRRDKKYFKTPQTFWKKQLTKGGKKRRKKKTRRKRKTKKRVRKRRKKTQRKRR